MPNLKSIKRKIASIKSTRQITKAMKMVSAAKFKKNLVSLNVFKPYADTYADVIKKISQNTVLYSHPFFKKGVGGGNIGIIIVSTDRGLCGSFNVNLFKLFFEELKSNGFDEQKIRLYILGKKGADFFKRHNFSAKFSAQFKEGESNGDNAYLWDRLGADISGDFRAEEIETLFMISNRYISTLSQKAVMEKILPLDSFDEPKNSGGYLIEPLYYDDEILDKIFNGYLKTKIKNAIFESFAGEQASRMNAMENATRNAGHLINKLTVSYNKARQAAVTSEILDIINGVNVLK